MKYIQCVRGKVPIDEIKNCDAHTHLIAHATEELIQKDIDLLLDSKEKIGKDLEIFKQYEGNLIAEMTTVDYRRDLKALYELSCEHNIHIIATAGYNKEVYNHIFLSDKTIDDIVLDLINELQNGVGEHQIKAGLLKIGTSLNEISECEEKGLRAIARAHKKTGIPISTHTQAGTMALEQLRLFEEEEVPYENLIICHLDQLDDYSLHEFLLKKGVYLSYDSIAKKKYNTRDRAISYIVEFAKRGLHKQILLGNDFARRSCLIGYDGTPGYKSIFSDFKQELKEALLKAQFNEKKCLEIIDDLYIYNPRNAFAIREIII